MSLKKQIQRNTERRNKETLKQYESFLKPNWQNKPAEDINLLAGFARNGITMADLMREVSKARTQAFEDTASSVMKVTYASVAVVLFDEFGFSKEDCFKVINAIDQKMAVIIDDEEIVNEMEEKTGIIFNYKEGVERVKML